MQKILVRCFLCLIPAGVALIASAWNVPRSSAYDLVAPSEAKTPEEERQCFHLPPGFEAQLVAAEPYVRKPININFDDRGRLWVTESVEYPYPAAAGARKRDAIRILEDVNGDGLADEVTTFADGLNIPIGVLPLTGGALVYSIPNILRLYDADGDDRADRRQVLYQTYGFRDTHGMTGEFTWGFDGWVYACHGFSNDSEVKSLKSPPVKMNSGNVYRLKVDGSQAQQFTWGQVNPFGLAFDPLGNLYSCDCHSRPIYQLLRGAYYPSFAKGHDGLGFGPEMIQHDHGSTGIAGIAYYAADHFPPEFRDNVFIGNPVTSRINRDRLERHGSTLLAKEQPDFLSSDDPWFRPVDIKLGPDGALYVADFYNRIIGHYEVPLTHPGRDRYRGRIWRIVYRGADGTGKATRPRPDWSKASMAELLDDLASPNLTVRFKATNQLVERGGEDAVRGLKEAFAKKSASCVRMHGLWVLERLGRLDDALLKNAAHYDEAGVRVHAMKVLSERPRLEGELRDLVLAGLKDADAFVQRAAADALGQHPTPASLRPLLDLRHKVPPDDTHLAHVVRMALRNHMRLPEVIAQLPADLPERDSRALADVAPGVAAEQAAGFLLTHVQTFSEPLDKRANYVHHIARFGPTDSPAALLELLKAEPEANSKDQAALFKALQRGMQERGRPLAAAAQSWGEELARKLLAAAADDEVRTGLELAIALKMEGAHDLLLARARDTANPISQRELAVTALAAIDAPRHQAYFAALLKDAAEPLPLRERAANALAGIRKPEAQATLLEALPTAPERLASAIALGLAGGQPGADRLLDAVAAGKASPRLLQDRAVLERLQKANVPDLKTRVAALTRGLPAADQRLSDLLHKRRDGFLHARADPVQGAKIYEKHCANCHQLANKGSKVGPQLDGVGIRGLDRLLEDILDPHRNVDQAFRATAVTLKNGQMLSGLALREEGQVLILADQQGKEVRIAKDAIEEKAVSPLSPMPANFAEQMTDAEMYHLLAFLLTQRAPANQKKDSP